MTRGYDPERLRASGIAELARLAVRTNEAGVKGIVQKVLCYSHILGVTAAQEAL